MSDSTDAIEEIAAQVEQLSETTARLRELGEREEFPAVVHTAERIDGVVATLESNLPPELVED